MVTIGATQRGALADEGLVLLEDLVPVAQRERLRSRVLTLLDEEGDTAGSEFMIEPGCRRVANLANKGDAFLELVTHRVVLDGVRAVLGEDIKLSSISARLVDGGEGQMQPLHCDMGATPDARGFWVCNTIWMLDAFTEDNGATRAVPGSHRSGRLPEEVLADPLAPHPDQVLITGPAGAVAVMNSHVWHGGTPNRTALPRLALHVFYCRRDKPQQFHQKPHLDAGVQAALTPEQRHMLALDDPENDRLSAAVARRSGFMQGGPGS